MADTCFWIKVWEKNWAETKTHHSEKSNHWKGHFAQAYSILPDVIMDLEQHLGSKESAPFRVKSGERITESNLSIFAFLFKQKYESNSWKIWQKLLIVSGYPSSLDNVISVSLRHAATVTVLFSWGLQQGCQTYGPWARSSPQKGLIRPARLLCSV